MVQPRPDHQQITLQAERYLHSNRYKLLLAWVYSAVAGITQWLTIYSSQKAWFTTFLAFVLLFSFFPDCVAFFFSPSSTWHEAAYVSCTVFLPLPVITGFTSSIFSQNVNSLFPFSYRLSHSYVRIFLFPACPVLDSHWRYKPAHQSLGVNYSWIPPRWGFSSVPSRGCGGAKLHDCMFFCYVFASSHVNSADYLKLQAFYKSEACFLYWCCSNIGR